MKNEVGQYYDMTLNHYQRWWKLNDNLSLHYGITEPGVTSFGESLMNTNRVLMQAAGIREGEVVLDAGCGVGGAAFYLYDVKKAKVRGITLSQRQCDYANKLVEHHSLGDFLSFHVMDYTQTSFSDESFDVVWACESVSSAPDKTAFAAESFRLLKKGGRLVMSDFFLTSENQPDPKRLIKKWVDSWWMADLVTADHFEKVLFEAGFKVVTKTDFTDNIRKSASRMYLAVVLGTIPSWLYNITHPKVSKFAKNHYKSGYYQYSALKRNLWKYHIFLAVK